MLFLGEVRHGRDGWLEGLVPLPGTRRPEMPPRSGSERRAARAAWSAPGWPFPPVRPRVGRGGGARVAGDGATAPSSGIQSVPRSRRRVSHRTFSGFLDVSEMSFLCFLFVRFHFWMWYARGEPWIWGIQATRQREHA